MDLRALRQFLTVAECGSYSRGSELLRISQPAVSRTIRNLEVELGRPLFKRHGHGVTLTDAGTVLLERSQMLLRQVEQTKADIRANSNGPSGVISIAVPPAAGHLFTPSLVSQFSRDYPNVFLKIIGGFSGYIHEWLVRGQVDLACVHDPLPQRGFDVTPLIDEEVFIVGKPGTFPFDKKIVQTDDLVLLPLILPSRSNTSRRLLENLAVSRGISLTTRVEVDDHTITRALLRQGLGFSLLTRSAIQSELGQGELEIRPLNPSLHWTLAILTVGNKPQSEILTTCIAAIKDAVHDLTKSGEWIGKNVVDIRRD